MFKKIVVPLDGRPETERALIPARAVAHEAGVPVELLMASLGRRRDPRGYLRDLAQRSGIDQCTVQVDLIYVQRLLDKAVAGDESLVCMTSECRSGLYQRMFGSMGSDLIRRTAASFLVVGPRAVVTPGWRPSKVLVCTDGSDTSRAIVPIVADWQAGLSPTVKVLQVVAPEGALAMHTTEGDAIETNVVRQIAEELGDGPAVDWDVLHSNDPARAILDEAGSAPDTVIAMATHGRSGLAHVTLGSVTDAVIRHSGCPVLTIRPQNLRGA